MQRAMRYFYEIKVFDHISLLTNEMYSGYAKTITPSKGFLNVGEAISACLNAMGNAAKAGIVYGMNGRIYDTDGAEKAYFYAEIKFSNQGAYLNCFSFIAEMMPELQEQEKSIQYLLPTYGTEKTITKQIKLARRYSSALAEIEKVHRSTKHQQNEEMKQCD